jgi:hypothetical protein
MLHAYRAMLLARAGHAGIAGIYALLSLGGFVLALALWRFRRQLRRPPPA